MFLLCKASENLRGEVVFIPEEISGYVEEEDENLREELPDWQKEGVKLAREILLKNPIVLFIFPNAHHVTVMI